MIEIIEWYRIIDGFADLNSQSVIIIFAVEEILFAVSDISGLVDNEGRLSNLSPYNSR